MALVLPVCVFVIYEIAGMGRRRSMLLSSTWRASPGELRRLLLELTRRVVREKKPIKLFRQRPVKPHPLRYNGAIYLRNWPSSLARLIFFSLQVGCSKEEERLHCVGSFAKAAWKLCRSGNGLWDSGIGLWLPNHHPPCESHS